MRLFEPFFKPSRRMVVAVRAGQLLLLLTGWQLLSGGLVPGPWAVLLKLLHLFTTGEFWDNLFTSLSLTVRGMGLSILIALCIAYLSVVPATRSLAMLAVKARYLTLTGLIFLFTLITSGGGALKMTLLVFGIVPFFVTSLLGIINQIPKEEYDLCRTLRMHPWHILWETIILGRADAVLLVIQQNFAIAWMMITMVEGLSMSEGGLGTMMIKSGKYIDLSMVFAILSSIVIIGLLSDTLLAKARGWLFPYTR